MAAKLIAMVADATGVVVSGESGVGKSALALLGPAGAFEQDVAFSSTVFRRRNILRANACSNAAAPRARSGGRRFMPPRTASSIL